MRPSLTHLERKSLDGPFNLSDGHARLTLDSPTEATLQTLLSIAWEKSSSMSQSVLESRFEAAFVSAIGPGWWSARPQAILATSASAAIDCVGKWMSANGITRVGLIEPAFDNIALILRRLGLNLEPLPENVSSILETAEAGLIEAVMLVLPNNPTGWTLLADEFADLERTCAQMNIPMIIDQSFRAFDLAETISPRLDEVEAAVIVIEDTGKTWPTKELKASFLLSNRESISLELKTILEEITLNVSPLSLAFLTELLIYEGDSGRASREAVAKNRNLLAEVFPGQLASVSVSPISVAVLNTTRPGSAIADTAYRSGVAVLPTGQFYWNQQVDPFAVRLALFRNELEFAKAIDLLANTLKHHGER